ncbi:MAG TPA: hypothetical protein VNZ53_00245 [Steroidobacteraceae bacterium]|nr:hypothetical protein [Steroidobacteraceae bacterium]
MAGFSVALAASGWNLTTGQKFPIVVTFDGQQPFNVSAAVIGPKLMAMELPDTQLILYPDANHGSFYQYPKLFVSQADQFLRTAGRRCKSAVVRAAAIPSIVSEGI